MEATNGQIKYLTSLIKEWDEVSRRLLFRALRIGDFKELNKEQASALIDLIKFGTFKANTEEARECLKAGLRVAEILEDDVSADKRAEIAARWGITFYLDRTR
jgi:hypothetical protein